MSIFKYLFIAFAVLLLGACGENAGPITPSNSWQIGPTINHKNYSVDCPLTFTDSFTINPCQPHYVTQQSGPLAGKSSIYMRYRIEGNGTIHGAGCESPSKVTLYFQRADDNWATDGYRWWATFASQKLNGPGEYEITAPLVERWTSVESANAHDDRALFNQALEKTGRVGFTFANCTGYGHGAAATEPMTFHLLEFKVR